MEDRTPEGRSRDGAAVRVFPPLLPLATIVCGVVLQRVLPIGGLLSDLPPVRVWIGGGLALGAMLLLGLWPVVLFRRSGQNEAPWAPTPSVIERGPYQLTRNPMYLQMVLVCIGIAIALGNTWILILTPLCAWALQRFAIRHEEAYLEGKFGEAYVDYTRRVRRWF